MCSFLFGFGFLVVNATGLYIKCWCHNIYAGSTTDKLDCKNSTYIPAEEYSSTALLSYTLIVSISSLGLAVGCLLSTFADKFGRLPVLIATTIMCSLCYLGQFLAREFDQPWLMILCRAVVGVAGGIYETTNVVYIIEVLPDEWTFFAEASFTFGNNMGLILGLVSTFDVVFGTAKLWHYAFLVGLLMSLIAVVSFVLSGIESIEHIALISS